MVFYILILHMILKSLKSHKLVNMIFSLLKINLTWKGFLYLSFRASRGLIWFMFPCTYIGEGFMICDLGMFGCEDSGWCDLRH